MVYFEKLGNGNVLLRDEQDNILEQFATTSVVSPDGALRILITRNNKSQSSIGWKTITKLVTPSGTTPLGGSTTQQQVIDALVTDFFFLASPEEAITLYNSDGEITEKRTLQGNGNSLAFENLDQLELAYEAKVEAIQSVTKTTTTIGFTGSGTSFQDAYTISLDENQHINVEVNLNYRSPGVAESGFLRCVFAAFRNAGGAAAENGTNTIVSKQTGPGQPARIRKIASGNDIIIQINPRLGSIRNFLGTIEITSVTLS